MLPRSSSPEKPRSHPGRLSQRRPFFTNFKYKDVGTSWIITTFRQKRLEEPRDENGLVP